MPPLGGCAPNDMGGSVNSMCGVTRTGNIDPAMAELMFWEGVAAPVIATLEVAAIVFWPEMMGTAGDAIIGHMIKKAQTHEPPSPDTPTVPVPNNVESVRDAKDPIPGLSTPGGIDLPINPGDLLDFGYSETTPEGMRKNTESREYENERTNDKVRYDPAEEGASKKSFKGKDHYHRYNPNSTGTGDQYLDKNGDPTPRGSKASHLVPEEP